MVPATGKIGRMELSLSEMRKTENGAGLEMAHQHFTFEFVKCEFSTRQIKKKIKIASDSVVCHKENICEVSREVLLR